MTIFDKFFKDREVIYNLNNIKPRIGIYSDVFNPYFLIRNPKQLLLLILHQQLLEKKYAQAFIPEYKMYIKCALQYVHNHSNHKFLIPCYIPAFVSQTYKQQNEKELKAFLVDIKNLYIGLSLLLDYICQKEDSTHTSKTPIYKKRETKDSQCVIAFNRFASFRDKNFHILLTNILQEAYLAIQNENKDIADILDKWFHNFSFVEDDYITPYIDLIIQSGEKKELHSQLLDEVVPKIKPYLVQGIPYFIHRSNQVFPNLTSALYEFDDSINKILDSNILFMTSSIEIINGNKKPNETAESRDIRIISNLEKEIEYIQEAKYAGENVYSKVKKFVQQNFTDKKKNKQNFFLVSPQSIQSDENLKIIYHYFIDRTSSPDNDFWSHHLHTLVFPYFKISYKDGVEKLLGFFIAVKYVIDKHFLNILNVQQESNYLCRSASSRKKMLLSQNVVELSFDNIINNAIEIINAYEEDICMYFYTINNFISVQMQKLGITQKDKYLIFKRIENEFEKSVIAFLNQHNVKYIFKNKKEVYTIYWHLFDEFNVVSFNKNQNKEKDHLQKQHNYAKQFISNVNDIQKVLLLLNKKAQTTHNTYQLLPSLEKQWFHLNNLIKNAEISDIEKKLLYIVTHIPVFNELNYLTYKTVLPNEKRNEKIILLHYLLNDRKISHIISKIYQKIQYRSITQNMEIEEQFRKIISHITTPYIYHHNAEFLKKYNIFETQLSESQITQLRNGLLYVIS